jgi:hypothetical protein
VYGKRTRPASTAVTIYSMKEPQPEPKETHEQVIARLKREGRMPTFEQFLITAAEAAREVREEEAAQNRQA